MCLLALFFRVVEDAPVIVGANREELYERGGEPPRLLPGRLRAVAGVDPVAGGTWLGVNENSVLVALTNRRKSQVPAQPRSRGLLVRELLGCATAEEAAHRATRELAEGRYAGCNVLCVDAHSATVVHAGDWLRVRPLPPGLHILTNRDVNDASDRRLGYALRWLGEQRYLVADHCLQALRGLCPQRDPDCPMCLHEVDRGTVSSTLVALHPSLARSVYWHAQGPPDRTPYVNYSPLLQDMSDAAPVNRNGD
jgi:hypothetical protein